ncbi:MAG TPA: aminotransferase class V-fold PLP-dependent enzyme [Vicinamibacteria bacterium]|nr:aminotransferase class V-fold PLP-dependent enzyme [Vicinamibacteria bacterium]
MTPYELEPSPEEMRRLVEAAMARIVPHVASLAEQPAADMEGAEEVARALAAGTPRAGRPLEELLALLFDRAVPKSFNTAGPGYLAYIPGGGIFASAVADLIADAVNRYVGVWIAAPALAQLETNVVRFFSDLVGFGSAGGGILTSGGSIANFSAVVTARSERLPEDFLTGTLYVSEETHHSVRKAAKLAGFPDAAVRTVPVDDRFRLRTDALEDAVREDRAAGRRPFMVVANAGSTNTGAVDDLRAIADLAREEGLWFHVDGAYGGFFLLTERGRDALRGIERADSVVLDPHKGLFLPYGTGSLVVRDVEALRRAHAVAAEYMPPTQAAADRVDFCEISPELSRDFRGLRVWLPLNLYGTDAFARALDEKLELARWAAGELRGIPHVEIVAEPQLSLVAFRLAPATRSAPELDQLNRRLVADVNARRRVHLSGTTAGGRYVARICVLSFRTHRDRVEQALADIRSVARELL